MDGRVSIVASLGSELEWKRVCAIMSVYGLHGGSTTIDFVEAIDAMATEAVRHELRIADLEAKLLAPEKKKDEKKKEWRESKAYQGLEKRHGCDK